VPANQFIICIKFDLDVIFSTVVKSSIDGVIGGKLTIDILNEGYFLFGEFGEFGKLDCFFHGCIV
jgi:hypothetical protein